MRRTFWLENLKDRDHVRPRLRWECNIKVDLKERKVSLSVTG
jgi:hypothetical protein